MDLLNTTITDFTGQLSSAVPIPGVGGASALAAAVGVALGSMVGELTIGKKKYASVEAEMKTAIEKARTLRCKLLSCIEMDAVLFEPLSKAYRIPKDDPGREEIMEGCLQDAASAPLTILDLTAEAIELLAEFSAKGSRLVVSDAATGAMLCHGALYGAAMNVKVNTRLMKDITYAASLDRHVDEITSKYGPMAEQIFSDVYGR